MKSENLTEITQIFTFFFYIRIIIKFKILIYVD
jgi:hypothetical protein